MMLRMSRVARFFAFLAASLIIGVGPGFGDSEANYTPWGVDEYELFGLTKQQLKTKFLGKLYFSTDYSRALFKPPGAGMSYQGPVFKLLFEDGKVTTVCGVFEGCKENFQRPRFDSKEAALEYAINGLSSCSGKEEQASLSRAKRVLAELRAIRPASSQPR
jgi:hypothetical protein